MELLIPTGLRPACSYVSELAAVDQPFGHIFRATDLAAGLLILTGALTTRTLRLSGRRHAAGWGALAVFGLATAIDSWLPMSCAPTSDPACAYAEAAGLLPAAHAAHTVSSALAVTSALTALVLLAAPAHDRRQRPLRGRAGTVLLRAQLVATTWTLTSAAAFVAGVGNWALGYGQRLQVLLIAAQLTLLARSVWRTGRR
ncbi:DUF998 domain-containing protein [Streptomyces sp. HUAS TT7]|uniref:DUF998 domain-containing protein n=1 Tax=Streptomyces sp. HUAS TT7 TaxID=3447507 RepID=UPI003F659B4A